MTFTHDRGQTLAPSAEAQQPVAYTYGLAAMIDEPDTLVAFHRNQLLISSDAGCSWRIEATFDDVPSPPKLVAAKGGRAYAWAENQRLESLDGGESWAQIGALAGAQYTFYRCAFKREVLKSKEIATEKGEVVIVVMHPRRRGAASATAKGSTCTVTLEYAIGRNALAPQ